MGEFAESAYVVDGWPRDSFALGEKMAQTQKQSLAEPSMEEILASIRRIISEEEHPAPANGALFGERAKDISAAVDDLVVFEDAAGPRIAPQIELRPTTPPPSSANGIDGIVSPPAATAASGAMTRLAGALRVTDQPGQTLEGLVRELLRPMLKEWLDQNLPRIVEAKVEAELERIARLAR